MRGPKLCFNCKSDTQTYKQQSKAGDKFILATVGAWDGINFETVTDYISGYYI